MGVQLRGLAFHAARPRAAASLGANANLAASGWGGGLVAADMTPVTTAQTGWATAFPAHLI